MSIESAKAGVDSAKNAVRSAHANLIQAQVSLLRETMLNMADRYPAIVGFSYEANWGYDDEGSYRWYVDPCVETNADLGTTTCGPFTPGGSTYEVSVVSDLWDDLVGVANDADQVRVWQSLTGSDYEEGGEITVEELRA